MTAYRLVAEPAADRDIEGAFGWYQNERAGLGLEFLDELRAFRDSPPVGRCVPASWRGTIVRPRAGATSSPHGREDIKKLEEAMKKAADAT